MRSSKTVLAAATGLCLAGLAAAGPAPAASGMLLDGTGAKEKGMAGAGLALPQDGVAAINNPAASGLVADQISIGATALLANTEFEVAGPGTGPFPMEPGIDDGAERWFGIPYVTATHRFGGR